MGIGFFIDLAVLQDEIKPTVEEALRKAYLKGMSSGRSSSLSASKIYDKMIESFQAFTKFAGEKTQWVLKPMIQLALEQATTQKMKDLRAIENVDEHDLDAWAIYMDEAMKM